MDKTPPLPSSYLSLLSLLPLTLALPPPSSPSPLFTNLCPLPLLFFFQVEPEFGSVYIDGVDTRTLGLHHLRSKMSIIPQDPFLYKGTVRRNLDPLSDHDDAELWDVLEVVGLKIAIR